MRDPLDESNMVITGHRDYRPLAIFLRDEAGQVRGGVVGYCWARRLYLEYLWVEERLRGQGHGARLLAAAEEEARGNGYTDVVLNTFDFQAPAFYPKYGYEIFAEFSDQPPGHTLYFLRKRL